MKFREVKRSFKLESDTYFDTKISGTFCSNKFMSLDKCGKLGIYKGYLWDGVSVLPMWINTALKEKVMKGSLLHDALYHLMRQGLLPQECKPAADYLMHRQFLADGLPKGIADLFYEAVEWRGHRYCKKGVRFYPKIMEV